MDRTVKGILACALGAFVGALVALEVNGYFWWVGMLAGGLVGYFSYEFKSVIIAIPRAWAAATSWQPDVEWWGKRLKPIFIYTALVLGIGLACSTTGFVIALLGDGDRSEISATPLVAGLIGIITGAGMTADGDEEDLLTFMLLANPIGLSVLLISVLIVLVLAVPATIRIVGKFFSHLFRFIHSDERLLCSVDAAIGAGIGYFAGNAVIGALVGGLWYALNLEVVSKRLLRVIPIKHN